MLATDKARLIYIYISHISSIISRKKIGLLNKLCVMEKKI